MDTLTDFHPAILYAVRRLSNPDLTFEKMGAERGITKQAVEKQFKKAVDYLKAYQPAIKIEEALPCQECSRLNHLIKQLRLRLVLSGVEIQLLKFFKVQVLKFFPKLKIARLPAEEKKQILDGLAKFKKCGGLVKDFALSVGKSAETLSRWQAAYDKYGLAGLANKSSRPKNFGNRVPLWIKKNLVHLFILFPRWTPYQYHSYIRHNPTTNWYVSLSVIKKLKAMTEEKSAAEIVRIKKRWCFAPGTKAWTVDFTCVLKTEHFKLQILTVSDHRSRYLLHAALYLNTSTETIMNDLEDLFVKYGKPNMIKADNGPEFRLEMRESLRNFAVYLFNSPEYYAPFNGAHERIHRKLKAFISSFEKHQNLTQLVREIQCFKDEYNYQMPMDSLEGKTPSDIFLNDESFTPKGAEIVTPYEKDGELKMKFTNREGNPARVSMEVIPAKI